MSLYDRVATLPGGGRALVSSRLKRSILKALHQALAASPLDSQAELASKLRVRRSAVNQVLRGDGNLRVSTIAEYLYEMGYELSVTLVRAGEMRTAALEDRAPVPAFPSASASASAQLAAFSSTYTLGAQQLSRALSLRKQWVFWGDINAIIGFSAMSGIRFATPFHLEGELESQFQPLSYNAVDLSDKLATSGAAK